MGFKNTSVVTALGVSALSAVCSAAYSHKAVGVR